MHSDQKTTKLLLLTTIYTIDTMEKAFSGYIDYLNSVVVEDEDEDKQYVELGKVTKRLSVLKKQMAKLLAKNNKLKKENKPKRPRSAYIFFCMEMRKVIVKENPGIASKNIMKKLGARWKIEKENDNIERFEKKANKDKKRYKREMEKGQESNSDDEANSDDESDSDDE